MDQYLFSQDEFILRDHEIGIEISQACTLPRLPMGSKGEGVVQDKDREGNVIASYLVRDGRKHGECCLFAEDGKLRAQMFYLDGKLHGPSVTHAESGGVLSKTWYCEGKRTGRAHYYYTSGALSSLQRFKNGQWEGLQEYFYENGLQKSLIPFQHGKFHGEVRLFWESGLPKRSVHYLEGLREGFDQLWNEKGILIDAGEYRAGSPVGVHRHYFAAGALKEELNFYSPTRFDRKEWDASGKLLFEGTFAPDLTYTEKVYSELQGTKVRKGVWNGSSIRWK